MKKLIIIMAIIALMTGGALAMTDSTNHFVFFITPSTYFNTHPTTPTLTPLYSTSTTKSTTVITHTTIMSAPTMYRPFTMVQISNGTTIVNITTFTGPLPDGHTATSLTCDLDHPWICVYETATLSSIVICFPPMHVEYTTTVVSGTTTIITNTTVFYQNSTEIYGFHDWNDSTYYSNGTIHIIHIYTSYNPDAKPTRCETMMILYGRPQTKTVTVTLPPYTPPVIRNVESSVSTEVGTTTQEQTTPQKPLPQWTTITKDGHAIVLPFTRMNNESYITMYITAQFNHPGYEFVGDYVNSGTVTVVMYVNDAHVYPMVVTQSTIPVTIPAGGSYSVVIVAYHYGMGGEFLYAETINP